MVDSVKEMANKDVNMEFIVLGGIIVVALMAWSLCLTKLCRNKHANRKAANL